MALITLLIKYVHHMIFQKRGGGGMLLLTLLKSQDQSYKLTYAGLDNLLDIFPF